MATITEALAGSMLAPIDARALMRVACGCDDAYLIAHAHEPLGAQQGSAFEALAARRRSGEPVAYIVGAREFFSLEFKVTPAVLIPRPETELLVELALEHVPVDTSAHVLDLGTGSGCIAISIAMHRPRAHVVAVDSSSEALAVARENARRHAVTNVEFRRADWFAGFDRKRFDLIVSNPPYVVAGDPHLREGDVRAEPATALVGGADGLSCIREIVRSAPRHLNTGGLLAFEHGFDQAPRACELMAGASFERVFSVSDLAGIPRVTGGYWTQS